MATRWNPITNKLDMTGVPGGETPVVAINGDTGQAEPDSSNEINFLGGDGCETIASGSTVTINVVASGFDWTDVTGTSDDIEASKGYFANNTSLVTLTLPSSAFIGDTFKVINKGTGFVQIAQNALDQINFGNESTTAGVTGYIQCDNIGDAITLVAYGTNEWWCDGSSQGNWNVV